MAHLYTIDLTINMPDGGRQARQLLNLYLPDMDADITAAASKLCSADPDMLGRKFAKLTVKRSDVWSNEAHTMKVFVLLSVNGDDPAFVKQAINGYMETFAAVLKRASGKYFTHNAFPPEISLQPVDWSIEIH